MSSKFERARADSKARKASGGGSSNFLKVPDEGEINIRILEEFDEIDANQGAYFHRTPNGYAGRKWGFQEICLDQDEDGNQSGAECPGCEAEVESGGEDFKRKLVFYINVIWRDQPVRKKNSKTNKWEDTDEVADQLAVWEVSQESSQNALYESNLTYKSLTNRDFTLRRRGEGWDTTYALSPVVNDDGESLKKALSKDDKKLVEKKPDLTAKVAKKEVEDWGKVKDKEGKGAPKEEAQESPFLNRNKKKDDEDE